MRKIAVIGRGTAGAQAAAHLSRWMPNDSIEWWYDPSIAPQTVGEGSTPILPTNLSANLNFFHSDLDLIDGTFKHGLEKQGWGKTGQTFYHNFLGSSVSYHFNAVKLQELILQKLSLRPNVTIKEANVSADQLDADYVMDCGGAPSSYDDFNMSPYIPVNSVYVTQCYWDSPRFAHTKTVAKSHGWVFGIPLTNRCSIGYLYNSDISSLDEVKTDVAEIFDRYDLTPSSVTNSFSFKNYYRKQNFTDRVVYNGNASFFLEPLEATSILFMDQIHRAAFDLWNGHKNLIQANVEYSNLIQEIQAFIMMHYFAGSQYQSPFWDMAMARGRDCLTHSMSNSNLASFAQQAINALNNPMLEVFDERRYGSIPLSSFAINIAGLDIAQSLQDLLQA